MSESIEEQLSALLDGELPTSEESLLMRRLEREPAHRETLARYSRIGECLRHTPADVLSVDLSERLRGALANEPAHGDGAAAASAPSASIRTGLIGAALAASVAVIALVSFEWSDPVTGSAPSPPAGEAVAALDRRPSARAGLVQPGATRDVRREVIAPARMTNYLVSHGEYTRGVARQINYAYVVNQAPVRVAGPVGEGALDE